MLKNRGTLSEWLVTTKHIGRKSLPWAECSIQEKPRNDPNQQIRHDLTPNHIEIYASEWRFDLSGLLDGFPYRQKPEAEGESGGNTGQLEVAHICRHGIRKPFAFCV